jgi:hypothetical protein
MHARVFYYTFKPLDWITSFALALCASYTPCLTNIKTCIVLHFLFYLHTPLRFMYVDVRRRTTCKKHKKGTRSLLFFIVIMKIYAYK